MVQKNHARNRCRQINHKCSMQCPQNWCSFYIIIRKQISTTRHAHRTNSNLACQFRQSWTPLLSEKMNHSIRSRLFSSKLIRLTQRQVQLLLQQRYMRKPMHLNLHMPNLLNWKLFDDHLFLNNLNAISNPAKLVEFLWENKGSFLWKNLY